MYFQVPVIAYDCAAIGGTLGGSGLLVSDKDPLLLAGAVNRLRTDDELRNAILENQKIRLQSFEQSRVKDVYKRQESLMS